MYNRVLLLLLLTVGACAAAARGCRRTTASAPEKCAAERLLWGWMDVAKQAEERERSVMLNLEALEIRRRNAQHTLAQALVRAKAVLADWPGQNTANVEAMIRRLNVLEQETIAGYKQRTQNEEEVRALANESREQTQAAYFDIRRRGRYITGRVWKGKFLTYKEVADDLAEMGMPRRSCEDNGIVSVVLQGLDHRLNNGSDLHNWKQTNLAVLKQAEANVGSQGYRCITHTPDIEESANDIRLAIERTLAALEKGLEKYDTLDEEVRKLELVAKQESGEVDKVDSRIIEQVTEGTKNLCTDLKKSRGIANKLTQARIVMESLEAKATNLTQKAEILTNRALKKARTLSVVGDTFSALNGSLQMPLKSEAYKYGTPLSTKETKPTFALNVGVFVELSRTAKRAAADGKEKIQVAAKLLKSVDTELKTWLSNTKQLVGNLDEDACDEVLSFLQNGTLLNTSLRQFGARATALMSEKKTIEDLGRKVALLEAALKQVTTHHAEVDAAMQLAAALEAEQVEKTAASVARVLRSLMKNLCDSAEEIAELQRQNAAFQKDSHALEYKISDAASKAQHMWNAAKNEYDMPQNLENELKNELQIAAVITAALSENIAKSQNLVEKMCVKAATHDETTGQSHDAVGQFVRTINLDLTDFSCPRVCQGQSLNEVVTSLTEKPDSLLKTVSHIAGLEAYVKNVRRTILETWSHTNGLTSGADAEKKRANNVLQRIKDLETTVERIKIKKQADSVAHELQSIMDKICASATKLHAIKAIGNGFIATAKALKDNVSVESRRAKAAWRDAEDVSGISQEVEDGFTYASRGVAALEKHLKRADAQYTAAANDLVEGLKGAATSNAKMYDAVGRFVRSITLNLTDFSSHSLCNKIHINELVTSLLQQPETMIQSAPAVEALRNLEARVTARLTAANGRMGKVVSSAADAQAAVEEATRRAHEAAAGRRCTPLHRQLLNVLQHIW
ncbi:hypothetical protein ERJ75_000179100 [Trypanosoma vivax]|nr:hypothetical protein ERJ75_000179100 [Trypanosoma vivax]